MLTLRRATEDVLLQNKRQEISVEATKKGQGWWWLIGSGFSGGGLSQFRRMGPKVFADFHGHTVQFSQKTGYGEAVILRVFFSSPDAGDLVLKVTNPF